MQVSDVSSATIKKPITKVNQVSFSKLYTYATANDKIFVFSGLTCAFLAGCAQPLIMFAFGDTMDGLSANTNVVDAMAGSVRLLGIFAVVMALLFGGGFYCLPISAVNQAHRIRLEFYKAILRQDMAFFDSKQPGELSVMYS